MQKKSAQCDIELSDCNKEILWRRLAGGNILAGVCYNSTSNMQEEEAKFIPTLSKHAAERQTKK